MSPFWNFDFVNRSLKLIVLAVPDFGLISGTSWAFVKLSRNLVGSTSSSESSGLPVLPNARLKLSWLRRVTTEVVSLDTSIEWYCFSTFLLCLRCFTFLRSWAIFHYSVELSNFSIFKALSNFMYMTLLRVKQQLFSISFRASSSRVMSMQLRRFIKTVAFTMPPFCSSTWRRVCKARAFFEPKSCSAAELCTNDYVTLEFRLKVIDARSGVSDCGT